MTNEDRIVEQLRLLSSHLARLELRQAEIAGRMSAMERYTVNTERQLDELKQGNAEIAAALAEIRGALG
jgi:F0F1-type ATP synthase gamma subunit